MYEQLSRAVADVRARFRLDPLHVHPEIELSDLLDEAIIDALAAHDQLSGCAVLATGGYGRRTLHPASDLDFLILFRDACDCSVARSVVTCLGDPGFEIGYQVKSLGDFSVFDPDEVEGYAAFFEARFLWGDDALGQEFTIRVFPNFVAANAAAFLKALIGSRAVRRDEAAGGTGAWEPNVKADPGGLRDYHFTCWISAILGIDVEPGVKRAAAFLQRVRNILHYVTASEHDVLTERAQAEVQSWLGYRNEPRALMGDYRGASKTLEISAADAEARARARVEARDFPGR